MSAIAAIQGEISARLREYYRVTIEAGTAHKVARRECHSLVHGLLTTAEIDAALDAEDAKSY